MVLLDLVSRGWFSPSNLELMDCVGLCGADVRGVHGDGGRGDSDDAGKSCKAASESSIALCGYVLLPASLNCT